MNQKIQAVMLPTEDESHIINDKLLGLQYNSIPLDNSLLYNPQHLYTTVSQDVEPIKKGDWCIKSYGMPGTEELCRYSNDLGNTARKIIATTDPKLTIEATRWDKIINPGVYEKPIPQLQHAFLKEFVATPDVEYEVEYNYLCTQTGKPCGMQCMSEEVCNENMSLKINIYNAVSITSVDVGEKIYSRKEVEALIYKVVKDNVGEYVDRWIEDYV
tara:strand:+ start:523 stop:1167 length:645 start_codon:yes stop_codon:yes gene_type:complete